MKTIVSSMNWHNEPARWLVAGESLKITADGKTDFWRTTRHGNNTDSGHFFFQEINDDFSVSVKIQAQYASQYDQAGLMVRLNKHIWLKCGVELVHEKPYASVVVTRDYSDWSMLPLKNRELLEGEPILFRVSRVAETTEVSFSVDSQPFVMFRQSYLTVDPVVQVGMMCASPTGAGFDVTFSEYTLQQLPKLNQSE